MTISKRGSNRTGDHLINTAPTGRKLASGRAAKRLDAKYANKSDMGRDELFKHRVGSLKPGEQKYKNLPVEEKFK